ATRRTGPTRCGERGRGGGGAPPPPAAHGVGAASSAAASPSSVISASRSSAWRFATSSIGSAPPQQESMPYASNTVTVRGCSRIASLTVIAGEIGVFVVMVLPGGAARRAARAAHAGARRVLLAPRRAYARCYR